MKVERLLNLVEEHMVQSSDAALMRRKDDKSGVLLIVYSSNVQEFLAQTFKAVYAFTGAEAPDQWYAYLAGREAEVLQAVHKGDLADAFKILMQMAAAERAGDTGTLQTLAAQLEEVLHEQAG
jgi:hypothetical protein